MSSTQDYLKKYMSKPASSEDSKKRRLKKKKTSSKPAVKKGAFAIHDEDEDDWKNAASDSDDDLPVVEQAKPVSYKSNSSSWAKIREGEPEPNREEVLQRNVIPEWDDVDNEDERPSIAGMVVESESTARLRGSTKASKESRKSKLNWKVPDADPIDSSVQATVQRRSPSPSRSRSGSPIQQKRRRSLSRSVSPIGRSPPRRSRSRSAERPNSVPTLGLQSAKQVRQENERKKQEQLDKARSLDPAASGRDAETVYRDSQGRKIDLVQEKIEKAEAKRREVEKQERLMEWGKGMVQREEEADKKKREQEEKLKPMARFKDDEELNEELKERDRWNDPAAMFLSSTKKTKKSARRYPLYQGNIPPNRFNIRPGYRWDGVDRSNGFEKSYFQRLNAEKNKAMEAHMWSVEDM
ncbi:hypothetical protein BGZ76_004988 [Entomortierella beljakovae]|nr:hypothetical protein BGZ76_004988 [Entomortierella beljakovae]